MNIMALKNYAKRYCIFLKKDFVLLTLFEWGCGIAKAWQSKYTLHTCALTSRLYGRKRPTLTRISMARQGRPWFNGRVYANAKFIPKCFYFNYKKIPNSNFKIFCLRAGEDCQPDKFLHFPSSVHTHTHIPSCSLETNSFSECNII